MERVFNKRLILTVGLLVLLTNPLVGQYIIQIYENIFSIGGWIGLVGTVYLVGFTGYYFWKTEKDNIPPKAVRRSEKYLKV